LGVEFSSKQKNGVMRILTKSGNDEDKSKEILRFLIDNGKNSNEKLLAALGVGVGGSALAYMLGQSHGEKKDAKSKKQQKSPRTPSRYTNQQSSNWRDNLHYASPRNNLQYAVPR
jgi:1,4-alpha-glucan branching enzyme